MKHCLFLGDSITDANHLFSENPLGNGFVSLIGNKLRSSHSIVNRGHDGFTIEHLLRMLIRDGVFAGNDNSHWDYITILIGVNDVSVEVYTDRPRIPYEYEAYYRKVIDLIQTHSNAKLILMEPFIFDQPARYKSWQSHILTLSQSIQKLADDYNALFIPSNKTLQNACKQQGTTSISYDGIHLTELGNQILADLWLSAVGDVL